MNKFLLVSLTAIALVLGGCSTLGTLGAVYQTVTETTVPASVVVPAANAFDILKAGATNYGRYCIANKMAPAICSASIRRTVIQTVRSGTAARNQLETSVATGQPALGSVYNVLVSAVNGLKATPAANYATQ